MGLRKNTVTEISNGEVVYTIDNVDPRTSRPEIGFYRQRLPVVTTGVLGGYGVTSSNFIKVPVDYIVYGRSPSGVPEVPNPTTSGVVGDMFRYERNAINFGIGLHDDYFSHIAANNGDWLSYPAPVLSQSPDKGFTPKVIISDSGLPEKGSTHTLTSSEAAGKTWGYLDSYSIRTDKLTPQYLKLNNLTSPIYTGDRVTSSKTIFNHAISITEDWAEVEKEIVYDSRNNLIHYISLIHYKFRHQVVNDVNGLTMPYDPVYVNVLVDFKFNVSDGQTILVGIDILNDDLRNSHTIDGMTPDPIQGTLVNWYFNYTVPLTNFRPWNAPSSIGFVKEHDVNYIDLHGLNSTGVFPFRKHFLFHPMNSDTKQIESFGTFVCPSGIGLVYRHFDNSNRYFYYNPNQTPAPPVDWRVNRMDRSYWVPDNREPSRTLSKAHTAIQSIWALNPSGVISPYIASTIPASEPVYQTYNSKPTSHAICGLHDRSIEHFVTLFPGRYLEISSFLLPPGSTYNVGPTRYPATGIDPTLEVNARELSTAGIKYVDSNGKTFYILYILSQKFLYTYVIYENGRAKIYRLPKDVNHFRILGLKNKGPIESSYTYQVASNRDGGGNPEKFGAFKVDVPSYLPTMVLKVDATTHQYYLELAYSYKAAAQVAYERLWYDQASVELDDGTIIPINKTATPFPESTVFKVYLDLLTYIRNNPSVSLSNVTINYISADYHLPYVVSTTGDIDARPLALGNMTITIGSEDWPLMTTRSSGVIHIDKSTLEDGVFAINCTGLMDNIREINITWGVDNANWTAPNITKTAVPHVKNYYIPNTFFNYPLASNMFVEGAESLSQFTIRNPLQTINGIIKSQTDSSSNGYYSGPKITFTSKSYEKKEYFLPEITIYDKHKFIIGRIYPDNIVDVDAVDDKNVNTPVIPGGFFIPKVEDKDTYCLTFNFRCAPNYLDDDNKYTLAYENANTYPISGRLSTPMIKKWWIVGIPDKPDSPSNYIYKIGTYHWGEASIPIPGAGRLSDILTEKDSVTDISRENFNSKHGYFKKAVTYNIDAYVSRYISQTYIHDEYASRIVDHVENAAAGTDSYMYDIGTVWCSGYNTVPSGYMDFSGVFFNSFYNGGVLTSGTIPVGTYGIYLIVEDTLGHKTGIDLVQSTQLGTYNIQPTKTSFNYGV